MYKKEDMASLKGLSESDIDRTIIQALKYERRKTLLPILSTMTKKGLERENKMVIKS